MLKYILQAFMLLVLCNTAMSMNPPSKLKVYLFVEADCPCIYNHKDSFGKLLKQYGKQVDFLVVFVDKTDDAKKMQGLLHELNWVVPFKKDNARQLVKQLKPVVSTDCVVVDPSGHTIYKGAIDDGVKNMGMIKNRYLENVIESYLAQKPIPYAYMAGTGCSLN